MTSETHRLWHSICARTASAVFWRSRFQYTEEAEGINNEKVSDLDDITHRKPAAKFSQQISDHGGGCHESLSHPKKASPERRPSNTARGCVGEEAILRCH